MFRTKVWLTITLVTAGVIGGAVFYWSRLPDDKERESPSEITSDNNPLQRDEGKPFDIDFAESWETLTAETPVVVDLDVDHIEQGDQRTLVGNFDGAYHEYVRATNKYSADLPATLLLRLAITSEQMGDYQKSNTFYQTAIRRSSNGSLVRVLGLTGVARIWQKQGFTEQAHEVLAELFLRYISNEQLHEEVRFQIASQLSNIVQQRAMATLPERSLLDSLEFHWPSPSIDAMIDILQDHGDASLQQEPEGRTEPRIDVLQRPSGDLNLIAIDAKTSLMPVEEVIGQLSVKASINFNLSRLAKDSIGGRSTRLDFSGLPAATMLDHVFSPLGLIWLQSGDTVNVLHESESKQDGQAFQFDLADRMLRTMEMSFPPDIRRNAALLHRGNLGFLSSDAVAAATHFAKLGGLVPNNELAAKLSFNWAMVEISNGNLRGAVDKLFFCVDQSLNRRLQSKSYAWIGRLELQEGRADRAIYALSRGLTLAEAPMIRQDVLMNLAKAYLLENDPFSANRVLFNHADDIVDPSEQKKAALFAAYARYLGMVVGEGLRNEGERMVVALAAITPEDANEFVDRLLIGRAFAEVGFKSRSSEFLELALGSAPHEQWRRRVAFELATNQYREGEYSRAEEHYRSLLNGAADETTLLAQIKLAEIALMQKRTDDCLTFCKQIWKHDINDQQKATTLSLMGKAFQRQGRHRIAAICFSGMVPLEVDGQTDTEQPSAVN